VQQAPSSTLVHSAHMHPVHAPYTYPVHTLYIQHGMYVCIRIGVRMYVLTYGAPHARIHFKGKRSLAYGMRRRIRIRSCYVCDDDSAPYHIIYRARISKNRATPPRFRSRAALFCAAQVTLENINHFLKPDYPEFFVIWVRATTQICVIPPESL
jgi:hypothetical protein